jgi:hypothetical protein
MIARSGHIVFGKSVKYKDLARVFPDLFHLFLKETGQIPEDAAFERVLVKQNQADLLQGKKPEGYNRDNKMRLVFPLTRGEVSFYVYRVVRSEEVVRMTDTLSSFLRSKGLPHKVYWDRMLLYQYKEKKARRAETPPPAS